jgi:hypothetical protein
VLKVEGGEPIYIGYADFNLRNVFPVKMPGGEDVRLSKHAKQIRERHYHIEAEHSTSPQGRTADITSEVYFYSIRLGTIIMGV